MNTAQKVVASAHAPLAGQFEKYLPAHVTKSLVAVGPPTHATFLQLVHQVMA